MKAKTVYCTVLIARIENAEGKKEIVHDFQVFDKEKNAIEYIDHYFDNPEEIWKDAIEIKVISGTVHKAEPYIEVVA